MDPHSQYLRGSFPTALSVAIVLITFVYDLATRIQFPKSLRKLLQFLTRPFENFLTIQDIADTQTTERPANDCRTRALVFSAVAVFALWIGRFAFEITFGVSEPAVKALAISLCWGYAALRSLVNPPLTVPYITIFFAFVQSLASFINVVFGIVALPRHTVQVVTDLLCTAGSLFHLWVAGTFPLQRYLCAGNIAKSHDAPSSTLSGPEDDVDLWEWSTFTFVQPVLALASKRTLNESDVWTLSPYFQHKNIFEKYLQYHALHPNHSLLRFLIVSNSLDLIIDVILEMWSAIVGFVPPYSLQKILSILASDDPQVRSSAYFWAALTFVAHLSFAQFDLYQGWHTRRCYERTRGQLFCSLHYKALKRQDVRSKASSRENQMGNAELGKIVNLMQGDSYAVAQRFWEFSQICTSPVRLIIALVFLYQVLGWSALSGVVLFLLAYVVNYPLAKYNVSITRSAWKAKDNRMNIVNELLQNIRFLKFYGWELQWAKKTRDAREDELKWRVKENIIDTLISFIWTWIPSATILISFLCYTMIAKERLTVSKAFTAIALFTQLQGPMTSLPSQIFAMIHAYVSMQRIEEFLNEEEVPDWASTLVSGDFKPTNENVGFISSTHEWPCATKRPLLPRFRLGPLDISFPVGKLTLVTGATGSGKTALILALLGELDCVAGEVVMDKSRHRVAYCGQNPWLEHATIRDNIIFNSDRGFEDTRYRRVVNACGLTQDLATLEAGDMTEIGEKGITLSGGQRARVALARAMYSEAKCILLDDPLAAVDMHTARHIATNCFGSDLAKDRTIILVTHHVRLCIGITSYIVELSGGRVISQGSVQDLRESGDLQGILTSEDNDSPTEEESQSLSRNMSTSKVSGLGRTSAGKLIEEEARTEGQVSLQTYVTYVRAAGKISWLLTIFLMLIIRLINIGNQVFLARWGEAYQEIRFRLLHIQLGLLDWIRWTELPPPDIDVRPWLLIFLCISLAGALSVLFYISIGYYASLQASRSLFLALLRRLTHAPSRFFDITPIGRILNRFTTDINTIDGALQNSARNCLSGGLDFVASFAVILFVVPKFAPLALFIAWLYIRLAPPYIRASRDLRRLESVSLSPAFAGYDELLHGIAHIRAFGMENMYQQRFYGKVDKFQSFDHVYWLVNGWLRWRYDCLGSVIVFAATAFALSGGVSNGYAAIVIVQAGIFAEASRQLVKVVAQLELDFNSVERVVEYLDVAQEAPAVIEGHRPPAYWPAQEGGLQVENLVVRYATGLPAVLRNISFNVNSCEKVGIVGRTGSGKSTLALSLLRIIEPSEGRIFIDGIDIGTIGLEDLRTRVTIVSQDVSIFSGSMRLNLDPLGEHTDEECLDVLKRCHLLPLLARRGLEGKDPLDVPIAQGSLSGGEKQLISIARAILRRTNIIIMDQATSQVDSELDDQIQRTVREELMGAIVLTIAHRLKTIMDYDRVLVMDSGRVVEFGPPRELLARPDGVFWSMCRNSADWPILLETVEQDQRPWECN